MPHDGKRPRPKTARQRTRAHAYDRMQGYIVAAAVIEWAVANLAVEQLYQADEHDQNNAQGIMLDLAKRLYERAADAANTAETLMPERQEVLARIMHWDESLRGQVIWQQEHLGEPARGLRRTLRGSTWALMLSQASQQSEED